MEPSQDLSKKIQNVKIAITVIIAEIKKLDKNISISQGLHDDKGFYRLICREINYAKENIWGEYNLNREFFPPIQYNGITEPDFKNDSILLQLNEFKTVLENTSFDNLESFEKFINEQQQNIINLI
jgi:hypothetical protein